jgi:hypothetical protein
MELFRSEPEDGPQPVYVTSPQKPLFKYRSHLKRDKTATFWSVNREACGVYSAGGYGGPVHYGGFRSGGLRLVFGERDGELFNNLVLELMRLVYLLATLDPTVDTTHHPSIRSREDLRCFCNGFGRHSWPQDVFCFASETFNRVGMWPWMYTVLEANGPDRTHTMVATEVIVHNRKNMVEYVQLDSYVTKQVNAKVDSRRCRKSKLCESTDSSLGWGSEL